MIAVLWYSAQMNNICLLVMGLGNRDWNLFVIWNLAFVIYFLHQFSPLLDFFINIFYS